MSGLSSQSLVTLEGEALDASHTDGRVVLFVNVASRCGLTPQYSGLVSLSQAKAADGLTVIGVPCNQFAGQEPGTAEEIRSFCSLTYGVDFPLLEKQDVNGAGRSALYQWLIGSAAGGGSDVQWNFEKFLVGRDGEVVGRFSPRVAPDDAGLVSAIDAALGS